MAYCYIGGYWKCGEGPKDKGWEMGEGGGRQGGEGK